MLPTYLYQCVIEKLHYVNQGTEIMVCKFKSQRFRFTIIGEEPYHSFNRLFASFRLISVMSFYRSYIYVKLWLISSKEFYSCQRASQKS